MANGGPEGCAVSAIIMATEIKVISGAVFRDLKRAPQAGEEGDIIPPGF